MLRKFTMLLVLLCMVVISAGAQEDPTTTDDDGTADPQSTVDIFTIICETQAIVNFSGTMLGGNDIYFQVFSGAGGTGDALSDLRRTNVSGDYTFSERINYPEGTTIPAASIGSVYVTLSAAGDPDNSFYNEFVDDIQDGCADPLYPIGASTVSDGTVSPDGDVTTGGGGGVRTNILSPFGGVLNPGYTPPDKSAVVIGAREGFELPRQETPGLIFAECDFYPTAEPGIIYDTDEVIIFWSWFTRTEAQILDHIENVDYSITYFNRLTLPRVTRTEPEVINGRWWTFWYSRLGNLRPGQYYIEYKVRWDEPVFDGFEEFGPGTATPEIVTGCSFDVRENPDDIDVNTSGWPNVGG